MSGFGELDIGPCWIEGCLAPSVVKLNGKPLCDKHYDQALKAKDYIWERRVARYQASLKLP